MGIKWSEGARARRRELYKDPRNNPFYGRKHSKETRQLMSKSMKGLIHIWSPEGKKQWYKKTITPEFRMKKSILLKSLWQDEAFRNKCAIKNMKILRKVAKLGSNKTANKGEQYLLDILSDLFPREYQYNDGWFMLGRKFPDFVNINGQKKVIELFGEKFHSIFDIASYQEHYKQFGYDVLIIWGIQLRSKRKLIKLLKGFHAKG